MGDVREFEGCSVGQALGELEAERGCPVEASSVRVAEEGRGFLGFRPRRLVLEVEDVPRVTMESNPPQAGRAVPKAAVDESEGVDRSEEDAEVAGAVVKFLADTLRLAGLEVTLESQPGEGAHRIMLSGADDEVLQEQDGRLLSALQLLADRVGKKRGGRQRVHLESGEFRQRTDQEIEALAQAAAAQVLGGERSSVRLPPLNPYERRLVHVAIGEQAGLVSLSEGNGFLKRVEISRGEASPGRRGRERR